ncbi:MAG: hypothetical protein CMJ31_07505 [Phycisphaerae bacterium]|nr:hypothetical protein [Phycisphaerae bacterium]
MTGEIVLTLGAGGAGELAVNLLIVLACAGLVASALHAVRISPIPGYLIAGALIGPGALGLVGESESIDGISSLAVVMLMFGIGLHLDVASIRSGARAMLVTGIASTLLSTFALAAIGVAVGMPAPTAVAAGAAVAMSSTAVVLQAIQQRRELHRGYGRLGFGVLIVQDLLVIAAMAAMPLLAAWLGGDGSEAAEALKVEESTSGVAASGGDAWWTVLLGGAARLGTVAAMIVVGRLLLPRALVALAKTAPVEVVLVVSAAIALGLAVVCGALGFSPELGAFIAGFLLSATPLRYQLGGQLAPLRDLFMAVLFTAVGLRLEFGAIADVWWAVILASGVVIALKSLFIGGSAWASGVPASTSAQTGLSLAQSGEFSLVLIAVAVAEGAMSEQWAQPLIAVVVATLLVTPALMAAGRWAWTGLHHAPMAPWVRAPSLADRPPVALTGDEPEGEAPEQPNVVIAGYGPVGRACADRLELLGVRVTIIELNTATVRRQLALGRSIIYGDITNAGVLESAGVPDADAVLLTVPDEEAMLRACQLCRRLAPSAFIAARAAVLSRGIVARELGADDVTVAEIATAASMADSVATALAERTGRKAPTSAPAEE